MKKAILILFIILFIFTSKSVYAELTKTNIEQLSLCLRNKGFSMYGKTDCSACAIEKGYFGEYFTNIRYINCDEDAILCQNKNIRGYPTWEEQNKKQYKGAMTLELLSNVSGCVISTPIPENTVQNTGKNFIFQPLNINLHLSIPPVIFENIKQLAAAFIAGLISFLAPCLLPLLPSYFSVITGFTFADLYGLDFGKIRKRVVLSALFFSLGFGVVFTVLGATGSIVGQLIDTYLPILLKFSGIFLIVLGLIQLGVIKFEALQFDFAWNVQKKLTKLGYLTAIVTGIAASLSWIPCISPLLTPVLILSAKSETVIWGSILLFVFSIGLTVPFIITSLFFPVVVKFFRERRMLFHKISQGAGLFMVIFGLVLIADKYKVLIQMINTLLSILHK